jgi:hypothetical protein
LCADWTKLIAKSFMRKCKFLYTAVAVLISTAIASPLLAQDSKESKKNDEKKPDDAQMMAMMMELAKPGENHQRLQEMAGTWSYAVKWWMNPEAAPSESSGTATVKSVMDGRYLVGDHTGKMQMPGQDGKMIDAEFKGMSVEGYDNARKKFVASWIDNMGTGIMTMEGTYDHDSKTFTYLAEYEMMPGMKTKMREVIRIKDKDHHTAQFFEDRGGKEVKTMEITYTRKT